MKIDNAKAQMRKGVLEYCILLVLDGKPLYASDIIQGLKEAKMIVVEGTLYPLLTRLKNTGFLTYRWGDHNEEEIINTFLVGRSHYRTLIELLYCCYDTAHFFIGQRDFAQNSSATVCV